MAKKKKAAKKKSAKKKSTNAPRLINGSEGFRSHNPNFNREENLFSSRFLFINTWLYPGMWITSFHSAVLTAFSNPLSR